jgi:G2/mitotic-specific cyclin 2
LHDENRVQHKRVTRSKLASATTEITTTTATALPSKVGNSNNNNAAVTRKRAALGDVTNAHKKTALGDITNAVLKREEKPAAKRPINRKASTVNVKKPLESKPLATKQQSSTNTSATTTSTNTNNASASTVIPKKRPSEAVVPRRTLTQSTSTSSLAQKNNARVVPPRRRAEEAPELEAPRKRQKLEQKPDWDDLDAADANDPLMVSEYVIEIFDYMRELEVHPFLHTKNTDYRSKQCQIQHI